MKGLLIPILSILLFNNALAQQSCDSAAYRQFDFWLGNWVVTKPDGSAAGTNHVEKILGGCVLQENWRSAGNSFTGRSLNTFTEDGQVWHQTWMDSSGLLLQLNGGLVDGAMVLSGPGTDPQGAAVTHRITWTPNDDGTVRQHWQMQKKGASEWTTLFDGLYRRSKL